LGAASFVERGEEEESPLLLLLDCDLPSGPDVAAGFVQDLGRRRVGRVPDLDEIDPVLVAGCRSLVGVRERGLELRVDEALANHEQLDVALERCRGGGDLHRAAATLEEPHPLDRYAQTARLLPVRLHPREEAEPESAATGRVVGAVARGLQYFPIPYDPSYYEAAIGSAIFCSRNPYACHLQEEAKAKLYAEQLNNVSDLLDILAGLSLLHPFTLPAAPYLKAGAGCLKLKSQLAYPDPAGLSGDLAGMAVTSGASQPTQAIWQFLLKVAFAPTPAY